MNKTGTTPELRVSNVRLLVSDALTGPRAHNICSLRHGPKISQDVGVTHTSLYTEALLK